MMVKIAYGTYRITWSPTDEEFMGLVAEFSLLCWLAPTQILALEGIEKGVREVVKELAKSGESKVRITSLMHRGLVLEAAEENVSLNRLISSKLAR